MSGPSLPAVIHRRYRVRRRLGAGGMGQVVLVEDLAHDGALRALKWISPRAPSPRRLERLVREFEILSMFDHPHLLRVHDLGRIEDDRGWFFTADFLGGPSLAQLLDPLDLDSALEVLVQVLRGLSYLHRQGWVHGDLKPENVLLRHAERDDGNEACIIDFGLAGHAGSAAERVLGSVYYMAPECILGGRRDPRSDLYAVGVIAYRLLTGRLPFPGPGKREVIEGHLGGTPVRPRAFRPDLPVAIEELILTLLAKSPVHRPECADDVLAALREVFGAPQTLESRETTRAHVVARQHTGWERVVEHIVAAAAVADPDAGEAADAEPPRAVVVQSPSSLDLTRFRASLVPRLQATGQQVLEISESRDRHLAALIREVTARLPSPRFRPAELTPPVPPEAGDSVVDVSHWLGLVTDHEPLIVVLDDRGADLPTIIGRLDEAAALSGPAQLTWVVLQRTPRDLEPRPAGTTGRPGEVLTLDPLDSRALRHWLEQRFPSWHVPHDLFGLLEEESEGKPALLEKILCSMVDEGLLRRDWDGWKVASFEQPHHETPLVRWGMCAHAALSDEERVILEALVVLGGSGDIEWIARAALGDVVDPFGGLARLRDHGWIDREPDGSRYRFRHFFQLKAVRQSMSHSRWHEGNRRVADWLLQRHQQGIAVDPERLAGHLLHGVGDITCAAPFAALAARSARSRGRYLSAIRWLETLLQHEESLTPPELLLVLEELAEVRERWGPGDPVRSIRRRALELALQIGVEWERRAALALPLAEQALREGDASSAIATLDELAIATQDPSPAIRRRSLLIRLEAAREIHDRAAERALWKALDALGPGSDPAIAARLALARVDRERNAGSLSSALDAAETALGHLEELERSGDEDGAPTDAVAPWALRLLATSLELRQRWAAAIRCHEHAAELFDRRREGYPQALALWRAGELELQRGRHGAATRILDAAAAVLRRAAAHGALRRLEELRWRVDHRSGARRWSGADTRDSGPDGAAAPPETTTDGGLLDRVEAALTVGCLDGARRRLEAFDPDRCQELTGAEAWCRWGVLSQRLALLGGDPVAAEQAFTHACARLDDAGASLIDELPIWLERRRLLGELSAVEEDRTLARAVRERLTEQPDLFPAWRRLDGEASETEILTEGEALDHGRFYFERARSALHHNDASRALLALEEARYHATRVDAVPLGPLASAHLALMGRGHDAAAAEKVVRQAWRRLALGGVILGRVEILALWSRLEARRSHTHAALALLAKAEQLFESWTARAPWRLDRVALARRWGLTEARQELRRAGKEVLTC